MFLFMSVWIMICWVGLKKSIFHFNSKTGWQAGLIAKQSKSSDLGCGQGELGSNPGKGMCFFGMVNLVEAILLAPHVVINTHGQIGLMK